MPTITISDKHHSLLKAVLGATKAEINWEEIAKEADMKTSKYARDQWTKVRNKLISGDEGGSPAAGTKRKDSVADTPAPTPKKPKTGKGKKAAGRAASEEDADDDEATEKVKSEGAEEFGNIF